MSRLNNQTSRVNILKALKESENKSLKESYVVQYFWGNETGYVKRDGDNYDRTPNKDEAMTFATEDEAENAKEDMNQFFGGRAKLQVITESSLKESDEVVYADDVNSAKLNEDAPYRRYKVSFYVDTNEMNNMDIEEKVDNLLKGSGLASADETINVEMIEELGESAAEESSMWEDSLKEDRVFRKLYKGDKFKNPNGVVVTIIDVDEEHKLDGEPQVTYRFEDGSKTTKCYKQSSVNSMLDQNRYEKID